MSLYNNIEKIKYTKSTSEVVNLKEYIVFENERKQIKYIVFKFMNNVSQPLIGMEFEVNQYNLEGALVETSVVVYDNPLAGANEEFVPNAKLKVNYSCKTISIKLRKAAYDRFIWNDGEYEDNSYKFEHYHRDEQSRQPAPAPAPEEKNEPQPKKKKQQGKPFELKNQTKKNIARFPAVFLAFVFIVVSVFVGLSLYFFKGRSDKFTLEDFKLRQLDGNDVSIYGYVGDKEDLEIPEKIGDYTVVRIESGAFTGCKMKTVTISVSSKAWYRIEREAFVNCKNLVSIYSTGKIDIIDATTVQDICKNCNPLLNIYMPNANPVSPKK